jgi:hypothetical protein
MEVNRSIYGEVDLVAERCSNDINASPLCEEFLKAWPDSLVV